MYIFQLHSMFQKYLGEVPMATMILGGVALILLIFLLCSMFDLSITKNKCKKEEKIAKSNVRIEKQNTKYELQKGKTLEAQIKNLEKEAKLKRLKSRLDLINP